MSVGIQYRPLTTVHILYCRLPAWLLVWFWVKEEKIKIINICVHTYAENRTRCYFYNVYTIIILFKIESSLQRLSRGKKVYENGCKSDDGTAYHSLLLWSLFWTYYGEMEK